MIGIAIALGPVLGGFITQEFGWEWAFYVNIPVGAAMIALTLFAVEESQDPDARHFDVLGFLSFSGMMIRLMFIVIGDY